MSVVRHDGGDGASGRDGHKAREKRVRVVVVLDNDDGAAVQG